MLGLGWGQGLLKNDYCSQNPVLLRYRREWIDTRGLLPRSLPEVAEVAEVAEVSSRGLLLLKCAHGFRRPIVKNFSCCEQGGAVAYVVGSLCSPQPYNPLTLNRYNGSPPGVRGLKGHTGLIPRPQGLQPDSSHSDRGGGASLAGGFCARPSLPWGPSPTGTLRCPRAKGFFAHTRQR